MVISAHEIAQSFSGKRVLVTGHTGFKGSWLCLLLKRLGAKVAGYALAPLTPSLYEILHIDSIIDYSSINDIGDRKSLQHAVESFAPEIVFHLAAQPIILGGIEHPIETFETNIMGCVQLLDVLRVVNKPVVAIIVTSDKCYKNQPLSRPYRETDMLGGSDPYTASKACAEIVTAAYRETYFSNGDIRVASARAGNVLGGGDFGEYRLIPDLYRAIKHNQPVTLRCPDAVRPWQYILDVLWGYLVLAGNLALAGKLFEGEYNFADSTTSPMQVKDIVSRILTLWNIPDMVVNIEKASFKETQILRIDPTKARTVLGWKNVLNSDEMLEATAEWYALLLRGDPKLPDYTLAHLDNYVTKTYGL